MSSTRKRRFLTLVTGFALLLGWHVTLGTQQAAALPGLVRAVATSPTDSLSTKTVTAVCPGNTRVIGGGGFVFALSAADEEKVMLTRLEPVPSLSGYVVTGSEVVPGITTNWWVEAYALCATAPAGYQLLTATTGPSSSNVQQIAAGCGAGRKVFGTGARITNGGGEVTLQTTRADNSRSVSQAVAKEDANGFAGNWSLSVFAVCANDLPGFVTASATTPTNSDDTKLALVSCPIGTFVHSTGGATSGVPAGLTTTPPGVALQVLFPFSNLRQVQVFAVETTPTSAPWNVTAVAICGP